MKQLRETGTLRIGVLGIDAPPFVFKRGGELRGADVDMARDFAGQLGLQPEFVRIPGGYNELVDAVRESVPQGCRP
jgi:ABC-type amino acid transport substrate-binding protein